MEAIRKYYRDCPARLETHVGWIKFIVAVYIAHQVYKIYNDKTKSMWHGKSALFGKKPEKTTEEDLTSE